MWSSIHVRRRLHHRLNGDGHGQTGGFSMCGKPCLRNVSRGHSRRCLASSWSRIRLRLRQHSNIGHPNIQTAFKHPYIHQAPKHAPICDGCLTVILQAMMEMLIMMVPRVLALLTRVMKRPRHGPRNRHTGRIVPRAAYSPISKFYCLLIVLIL